eukprot:SAG31_NODE_78_length_27447_cov_83.819877_2_plen_491_part_00
MEFAFWGRTDVWEITLQSCETAVQTGTVLPAVDGIRIVDSRISGRGAANSMLTWNFAAGSATHQVADGNRQTTAGDMHDRIVAVRLSGVCKSSSYAVYGSDRIASDTDLRHIRVAGSLGGTTWQCWTQSNNQSQGGTSSFAAGSEVCSEGPSHAASGSVFNIPFPVEFVEIGLWGQSDIYEVELTSCDSSAPALDEGLVLHLHLDEDESNGNAVQDASGRGNHAATLGEIDEGRFCRGRRFRNDGPQGIDITSSQSLEFGLGSFSVMGWARFESYEYPRTSFVAKNGHGCYFHQAHEHESGVARAGWNPGWEIGHGFNPQGSDVCIRDSDDNKARGLLRYDSGSTPLDLLGEWVHYAFVFDRTSVEKRVYSYINGVQQSHSLNIGMVTGSVDNAERFTLGTLYGWKTDGVVDEYRLYNRYLNREHVMSVFRAVPRGNEFYSVPDDCPPPSPPPFTVSPAAATGSSRDRIGGASTHGPQRYLPHGFLPVFK